MATIIAHSCLTMARDDILTPNLAGLLLSAILSDTLNLQSPTSTDMDAMIVGLLSKVSRVGDLNQYAKEQFKAKSAEIDAMSDNQLITGDLKKFACNGVKVGFGVVETTNPDSVVCRAPALLTEMPFVKDEMGFDVLFVAIVDIVNMRSDMLICGARELALAEVTFDGCAVNNGIMDMGKRVSRKANFAPPLTTALADERIDVLGIAEPAVAEVTELVMGEHSNGFMVRQPLSRQRSTTYAGSPCHTVDQPAASRALNMNATWDSSSLSGSLRGLQRVMTSP